MLEEIIGMIERLKANYPIILVIITAVTLISGLIFYFIRRENSE